MVNSKEDANMQEDLTFFKDDDDKNKDGSRVKNPKRVFAGKMAHKKHGASYKTARERINKIIEDLEKITESELTQDNPVNLYAEINMDNATGGIQIKFDEDNYANVDIAFVSQEESHGAFKLESETITKEDAVLLFNNLVADLKTLADTFDRDFLAVLKKNGLVRRVD